MVKHFVDFVLEKRTEAAYHEAGHFVVACAAIPHVNAAATVGNLGHGDIWIEFPEGTTREAKLLVAVAGFLAEAKGIAEADISADHPNTRMMAIRIDRDLRAGMVAFQVDVFLVQLSRFLIARVPGVSRLYAASASMSSMR